MLTPVAVAERTGVHANTVRRWIHDGLVPGAVRTPGRGLRLTQVATGGGWPTNLTSDTISSHATGGPSSLVAPRSWVNAAPSWTINLNFWIPSSTVW